MARPLADADLLRRIALGVFELVAEHGVDGASMRRVAERTNLSTGTLNYHFKSKEGLLDAALDYAYRLPRDWDEHAGDAKKALERLLRRYVLEKPEVVAWWRFWCAVTSHAAKNGAVAKRQEENQKTLVSFFVTVIEQGIAKKQLKKNLDARDSAERLVALAHGLALEQLIDPKKIALARRILTNEVARLA